MTNEIKYKVIQKVYKRKYEVAVEEMPKWDEQLALMISNSDYRVAINNVVNHIFVKIVQILDCTKCYDIPTVNLNIGDSIKVDGEYKSIINKTLIDNELIYEVATKVELPSDNDLEEAVKSRDNIKELLIYEKYNYGSWIDKLVCKYKYKEYI